MKCLAGFSPEGKLVADGIATVGGVERKSASAVREKRHIVYETALSRVMKSVMFKIRQGLASEERTSLLEQLKAIDGVANAAPLRPSAKNEAVSRMFYVTLEEAADPQSIAEHISKLPEIESADVPVQRYRVAGS